jgi:hypothetical protein
MFMHGHHQLFGRCSCVLKSEEYRIYHRWFFSSVKWSVEKIKSIFSLSLSQYEVSSSFAWKKESHHHLVSAYWIKIERKRRRRKKNSLFFFLSRSRSRFSSRLCIIGGDIISSSPAQLD